MMLVRALNGLLRKRTSSCGLILKPVLSKSPSLHITCIRSGGQRVMQGITLGVRGCRLSQSPLRQVRLITHPWNSDPPLPKTVSFDLSNHERQRLPSPIGWEIWQRNSCVLIQNPNGDTFGLCSAQFGMLVCLCHELETIPGEAFQQALHSSYRSQLVADSLGYIHWNRNFLARIQGVTGATLLTGVRAVTFNPHFDHFSSMDQNEWTLGAKRVWTDESALILLDSILPKERPCVLQLALTHSREVWILRLDKQSEFFANDTSLLTKCGAKLAASIPQDNLLHHTQDCWCSARWDAISSAHGAQLWSLCADGRGMPSLTQRIENLSRMLGAWKEPRFDFHFRESPDNKNITAYRSRQQDALQFTWRGLVAGTDGSVNREQQRMGAGYVLGIKACPDQELSIRVGGPMSTLRAEAASLYKLLEFVPENEPLLVFTDCLVILLILQRWGSSDFWPEPDQILHFDILFPVLKWLRSRSGRTHLFKVKSHSGSYLNERADWNAEQGCSLDTECFPGPDKVCMVHLRTKSGLQVNAGDSLLSDRSPNKLIVDQVVEFNSRNALKRRSTTVSKILMLSPPGFLPASSIANCAGGAIRCWMKAVGGIYPTADYLHRIGKTTSAKCPYCSAERETLIHFTCWCPRFHDARMEAHNRALRTFTTKIQAADGRLDIACQNSYAWSGPCSGTSTGR